MSACSSRHNKEATNCLSLWAPSLIPGSSSNNKPSGLFILALLWKEPLQIILQSLSWWRTISSTFIIVCIIFIFLTAGRRWRPWWWSTGRCLVRDKQHVIAQFKHFHLNSFITDRTNETFTDHSWSQQHIYIVLDRNCLDQMSYHEVQM